MKLGCVQFTNEIDIKLLMLVAPALLAEKELLSHFETEITPDRAYSLAMDAYDNHSIAAKYLSAASKKVNQ